MDQTVINYHFALLKQIQPYNSLNFSRAKDGTILFNDFYSFKERQDIVLQKVNGWDSFANEIKTLSGVARVRNSLYSRSHNFSFEISIAIGSQFSGLYINWNPIFSLYGIYFCSFEQKSSFPISINKIEREDLSYFPFNDEQLKMSLLIDFLFVNNFGVIPKIAPNHAGIQIANAVYQNENGTDEIKDIDLYQSLLSQSLGNLF